jgi:hypothetical protein
LHLKSEKKSEKEIILAAFFNKIAYFKKKWATLVIFVITLLIIGHFMILLRFNSQKGKITELWWRRASFSGGISRKKARRLNFFKKGA